MNNFKSAAITILEKSNTPLNYKEITRLALEQGILQTDGKTPEATMNAQIATEIKAKGEQSSFIRTAPSTYALNPNQIKKELTPKKNNTMKKTITEKIDGGFIGKGGEHYVTSELLFRGYNASIMSVDVGMDIIATKNNKLFSLQVKTSNLHNSNSYIFDMRKVSLARDYAGNVFYIFVVLHPEGNKTSIIYPESKLEELIHSNAIKDLSNLERFRVTLKLRNGHFHIGTMDNVIDDYYINNWGIIK